jgi:hypothetical protein
MAIKDLWPADIGETSLVTPVSLLREQAAALGPKTKNLVTAEVESGQGGAGIMHSFYLLAPALKYRYLLFTVSHPITLYPATCNPSRGASKMARSEPELIEWLQVILSSDDTKSVIRALIAQSRE